MAEFKIDRREALRYLGFRGNVPDSGTAALLENASAALESAARPRKIWRVFALRETAEGILLPEAGLLLPGGDIRRHLRGCARCILMATTLGGEADRLILCAQLTGMARAAALDAAASAAIEDVCDRLCAEMASRLETPLTARFSPGYGDLPLTLQKNITALLDTPRRIGLTVNESSLLIPLKSVTAVLGIRKGGGPDPTGADRHDCAHCALRGQCAYEKGDGCGHPR